MSWKLYTKEEIVLTPWETAQVKMSLPCKLPAGNCLLVYSQDFPNLKFPASIITSGADEIILPVITWMPDPLSVLEIKFNPIADSVALTYRSDATYTIPANSCIAQAILIKEQKEKKPAKPRVKKGKVSDATLKLRADAKADIDS